MPFGLRNSAQTFQRYIDEILADFTFAHPYIDDILIASPNTSEHIQHLRLVFSRLQEANLLINWSKCDFVKPSVTFLGHTISDHGHSPLVNRLQSIQSITPPKTVSDLRSFLGMVNYCHRYIPNCSSLTAPLSAASSGPKKQVVQWSEELKQSFERVKAALTKLTVLAYPVKGAPLELITDASNVAAGAVLQ